jgi:peptide/nickel transport system substrate-binding protein
LIRKTYIFYLKDNVYFSDKTKLKSELIKYNFIDVETQTPNPSTIIFRLKSSYAPFLVTVARPIFKSGFVGLGDYKVQSVKLNGDFVQSITLRSVKQQKNVLIYQFYPTQEALKTAFTLGEISEAMSLTDIKYKETKFDKFSNIDVTKRLDDQNLVTLFYNTTDKNLSDKRLREAISYAIPDKFEEGYRNYGPFSPKSWINSSNLARYQQDFEHSNLLLENSDSFKGNKNGVAFELKTFPKYLSIADIIKKNLEKINIKLKITVVDTLPSDFQMFLGDFRVPRDPDQYILWHSSQENNISKYKNLRIDKLLEDGRQIVDMEERKKIYTDFQKYLLDDPPATFLLFPYQYDIKRK